MTLFPSNLKTGLLKSQLPGLDGLRAIAAFLVVFYHFGIPFVSGGLGVLMFFVLSGFLITWLLLKENEECGTVSLRDFYIRRILRIFPAFYCYSALQLGWLLIRHREILWPQALASLLYVNNYYQGIHGDPNTGFSHTWSLAVEEQFYMLWPMAFLALRQDYRRMGKYLVCAIVSIWIYRAILVFGFQVFEGYIYEAFDTRIDHLLVGCLLAVTLRAGWFPVFWNWICQEWVALSVLCLLAASGAMEAIYGSDYRDKISFVVTPLLTAIWIAQIIALRDSLLWSWMNLPLVRYFGRISYSIYLYQQMVVSPPQKWFASFPIVVPFVVSVAAVITAASLSYFLVEKPFLKLKSAFGRRTVQARV
jgi:peptidoglycan/LPS O-acetylase OafA/YrhL